MTSTQRPTLGVLRPRDGGAAHVPFEELFFDLVFVFAVTQVAHFLLEHLTPLGAVQALVLWFALWLSWQYTTWVTNWFDPEAPPVRLLLFVLAGTSLVVAAVLPEAFGERGLLFGAAFALMEIGRTLAVLALMGRASPMRPNFRRILAWLCLSGALWVAGGLAEGSLRLLFWALAVACQYGSPMLGFRVPGLGRSTSGADWTIEGGHLVERCALFVIVALGESIVVMGATLGHADAWDAALVMAYVASFAGTLALWVIYFDTSCAQATRFIRAASDPGRVGAWFHYVHVVLIGGIIVTAVGNDLVIAHPHDPVGPAALLVLVGGAAIYLAANLAYKRIVFGRLAASHLAGLAALAALLPFGRGMDLLTLGALTSLVVLVVAGWDALAVRRAGRAAVEGRPGA